MAGLWIKKKQRVNGGKDGSHGNRVRSERPTHSDHRRGRRDRRHDGAGVRLARRGRAAGRPAADRSARAAAWRDGRRRGGVRLRRDQAGRSGSGRGVSRHGRCPRARRGNLPMGRLGGTRLGRGVRARDGGEPARPDPLRPRLPAGHDPARTRPHGADRLGRRAHGRTGRERSLRRLEGRIARCGQVARQARRAAWRAGQRHRTRRDRDRNDARPAARSGGASRSAARGRPRRSLGRSRSFARRRPATSRAPCSTSTAACT